MLQYQKLRWWGFEAKNEQVDLFLFTGGGILDVLLFIEVEVRINFVK